jgi:microcompartment protein CcmK/EutM
MGEEETTFGAIVVAGMTMLIGTKLLVGSMIELLSVSGGTAQLMFDSVGVTAAVAIILLVTTGMLAAQMAWSRPLAIVALAVVAILGRPVLADPDPVALGQTVLAILTILYLLVKNPIRKPGRSDIDDSDSAARIGSTIR